MRKRGHAGAQRSISSRITLERRPRCMAGCQRGGGTRRHLSNAADHPRERGNGELRLAQAGGGSGTRCPARRQSIMGQYELLLCLTIVIVLVTVLIVVRRRRT